MDYHHAAIFPLTYAAEVKTVWVGGSKRRKRMKRETRQSPYQWYAGDPILNALLDCLLLALAPLSCRFLLEGSPLNNPVMSSQFTGRETTLSDSSSSDVHMRALDAMSISLACMHAVWARFLFEGSTQYCFSVS